VTVGQLDAAPQTQNNIQTGLAPPFSRLLEKHVCDLHRQDMVGGAGMADL